MVDPRKLLWLLLSAASAAAAGAATRKLVDVGWRMSTGSDTPAGEDDDSASFGQALAWAAGVGAAAGVARIVSRRTAATVWEKTTGEPPPGDAAKA
jgi:hypothetical protein